MQDAVSAHVEFVQREHILRIVIANTVISAEFSEDGLFACQQVSNLQIELAALFLTDEVDLLLAVSPNSNLIASSEHLHEDNILENQIDITHITAVDCFADAVIGQIVFLICG